MRAPSPATDLRHRPHLPALLVVALCAAGLASVSCGTTHALAASAPPGVWVAGDEMLGDTRRGFLARVDADGAERTVLPIASVRHVVGVHRKDASHVLIVGDDRVAAPNPWDTQVEAIHIVIVDEDGP